MELVVIAPQSCCSSLGPDRPLLTPDPRASPTSPQLWHISGSHHLPHEIQLSWWPGALHASARQELLLPPHLHKQPYADDQGAEGSTWKPYTSEFKRKKSNLQTLNYFPGAQQLPFLALDFPHDIRGETTCRHAGELFGLLQHLDVPAEAGTSSKATQTCSQGTGSSNAGGSTSRFRTAGLFIPCFLSHPSNQFPLAGN